MSDTSTPLVNGVVSGDDVTGTTTGSEVNADTSTGPVDSTTAPDQSTAPDKSTTTNTKAPTQTGASVSVLTNKKLAAMNASVDKELNKNPDRGFRTEIYMHVDEIASWAPAGFEKMVSKADDIIYGSHFGQSYGEYSTIAFVYMYMDAYKYTGVDADGIQAIGAICEAFRRNGVKMRMNFCYQPHFGEGEQGKGATTEVLLKDIAKLKDVVHKNKDVIYVLQVAFVGAFGEWHSENPAVDKSKIIEAIANTLCPKDIYMIARLPSYKNLLPSSNPAYERIGFMNDCFFGKIDASAKGSGGLDPGTDMWNQWIQQGPYTPNDGELYINSWFVENNDYPEAFSVIQAMVEHRYTTLSMFHGYADAGDAVSAMSLWQKVEVTPAILKSKGYLYADSWFKDANGKTVKRNAYEYIRDYMGYHLEAKSVSVTGGSKKGEKINVSMPLVNYGFSAAFNLKSGFVILDENNKVVSTVSAGDPTSWHSTSPTNYKNRTQLQHTVSASMNLPTKSGTYKLAFFLKNDMGQFARLANDIPYVNGYNVLHTFTV